MDLKEWISANNLAATINVSKGYEYVEINDDRFLIIDHDGSTLFTADFKLIISKDQHSAFKKVKCNHVLFEFGGNWYCSPFDGKILFSSGEEFEEIGFDFNDFKHIGESLSTFGDDVLTHLGVHGGYELMNGSRSYSDWCKKAKFLGLRSMGICEKNTLAGTISFQMACSNNGIKSILGETVSVKFSDEDDIQEVKLYVLDSKGWRNLLHINKAINVDNDGFILYEDLLLKGEGLVFVWASSNDLVLSKEQSLDIDSAFDRCFYQFDSVEYQSNETDKTHLEKLQTLISKSYFEPIFINDSYYLDQQDSRVKKLVNKIDRGRALNQSEDQYFKDLDDVASSCEYLFPDEESFWAFFWEAVDSAYWVEDNSDFKIEIGGFKIPKYEMTPEEKSKFSSSREMLDHLIDIGMDSKVSDKDAAIAWDRIEEELDVIEEGGFVDYFLILWDIIKFCNREGILVGTGRGSAAGSFISYLLDIVKLNPMDYDLLFSRFLNKGRIKVSMPDIDTDFESERRPEVKRYMEQKYGQDRVCSIGTYGTLKLAAAIQDLGKLQRIDNGKKSYMTKILKPYADSGKWKSLFECAVETPDFKKFIQDYPDMINNIRLLMNQPKNASVHAAGVIIVPNEDSEGNPMNIFDWMPIKKMDGVLISEWEGTHLEAAGFLKEDILGIKQLDKFKQMFDLIEENTGERLTLTQEDIPLDDENVYNLFHEGCNGDVFQFGTAGLIGYSQDVKPNNIEDLIAMNALYRPGAMVSQAHIDFVRIRRGKKDPEYDHLLEEVTKDTNGLYIYQEQVMKAFQIVGCFTSVEADDIRRAMGKKKVEVLHSYKKRFIDNAISQDYVEEEAIALWDKLEAFAGYGFNKSHAAAYSIMGYMGQWIKYHHPMEYWAVTLSNADKEDLPKFISEINKLDQNISIAPPDINKSNVSFTPDFETNKIYWALKVKQVGDSTLEHIIEERSVNGQFFSFEEFIERVSRAKVNKGKILNLILAGAFDEIEKISNAKDRKKLIIDKYCPLVDKDVKERFSGSHSRSEHFWLITQKDLTGFGHLDYKDIIGTQTAFIDKKELYVSSDRFFSGETTKKRDVVIAGIIKSVVERKTKRGDTFANLTIESNDEEIVATVWSDVWDKEGEGVLDHKEGIIVLNGVVSFNDYHKKNTLQTIGEKTRIALV